MGESNNSLPNTYMFGTLSAKGKEHCQYRVLEIEEDLSDEFINIHMEGQDDVKQKMKIESVSNSLKSIRLREAFMNLVQHSSMSNEADRDDYILKYRRKIIVPAIRAYVKLGSKGNQSTDTLLTTEVIIGSIGLKFQPPSQQPGFNRLGRNLFEKCKQMVLQSEISRHFTMTSLTNAKRYFDRLTDERIGRLFRSSESIETNSVSGAHDLIFKISDRDYGVKSDMFNQFLTDMYEASSDFVIFV